MNAVLALALCLLSVAAPASADDGVTLAESMAAVVQLETPVSSGTGWLVAPDRVLTAAHVVDGTTAVTLLSSGRSTSGAVVGAATGPDLAIVEVDPAWLDAEPLVLRDDQIDAGADVYAVGHALGDATASVTRGIVGSVRDEAGVTVIQTDAAINPGVSGGPLLDGAGRVAGVLVSKTLGGEGIGHAVAAGDVRAFLAAPPRPATAPRPAAARMPLVVWPVAAVVAGGALALLQHRRRAADEIVITDDEIVITLGPVRMIQQQEPPP